MNGDQCKNGATCVDLPEDAYDPNGLGYVCQCAAGWTGPHCDEDIPDCHTNSCPPTAECIDLTNSFYCKCPFNLTGEDCRKPISYDYDLHFNDDTRSSRAAHTIPFKISEASSLTLAFWIQYDQPDSVGTFLTLYSVGSAHQPNNRRIMLQADQSGFLITLFPNSNGSDVFIPYLSNVGMNDGKFYRSIWSFVIETILKQTFLLHQVNGIMWFSCGTVRSVS